MPVRDDYRSVHSFLDASPAAFVKIFSMYFASLSESEARESSDCQNLSISGFPVTLKKPIFCRLSAIMLTVLSIRSSESGVYPVR